jgi:hypothetical protein
LVTSADNADDGDDDATVVTVTELVGVFGAPPPLTVAVFVNDAAASSATLARTVIGS